MDLDALEDKARAYNARNVAIAAIAATSVDPANTGDAAMLQMLLVLGRGKRRRRCGR